MNNNILFIILIVIISTTLIIYLLHKILKNNNNNKFAYFINRLWDEWFEEQWKAIIAFIFLLLIVIIISFAFNVKANVICNDGTTSTTCSVCDRGCCSKHGGCSDNEDNSNNSVELTDSCNCDYYSEKVISLNNEISNLKKENQKLEKDYENKKWWNETFIFIIIAYIIYKIIKSVKI